MKLMLSLSSALFCVRRTANRGSCCNFEHVQTVAFASRGWAGGKGWRSRTPESRGSVAVEDGRHALIINTECWKGRLLHLVSISEYALCKSTE